MKPWDKNKMHRINHCGRNFKKFPTFSALSAIASYTVDSMNE